MMAQLTETEKRYRYAMEATNDGIWDWNLDTNEVVYSPAYYHMLGYEASDWNFDRADYWVSLLHPDDRDRVVTTARERLESPGHYELECRMRAKDGAYRWILSRGKVVEWDPSGRPIRAVGTHVDIDSRKNAEQALQALNASLELKVTRRTEELQAAAAGLQQRAQELERSEKHFRVLADQSPVPIAIHENDQIISYINPAFIRLFGYTPKEIPTLAAWFEKAYPNLSYREEVQSKWIASLERARATNSSIKPTEVKIRCKGGEERTVVIGANFLEEDGNALIATFQDITDVRLTEDRNRRLGHLYGALAGCQAAILHAKTNREIFENICNVIIAQHVAMLVWVGLPHSDDKILEPICARGENLTYLDGIRVSFDPDEPWGRGPTGTAFREGRPVWCQDFTADEMTAPWRERAAACGWRSAASLPLRQGGNTIGVLTLYFDRPDYFDDEIQALLLRITESVAFALDALAEAAARSDASKKIEHLAHYDEITKLLNRYSFFESLKKKMEALSSAEDGSFAVHLIDLDDFKNVNDSLGHAIGDELLIAVARRLSENIRTDDSLYRIGGDEFVVLQSGVRTAKEVANFAQKLSDQLREPYTIGDRKILSSGTIGIAIYQNHWVPPEKLLSNADVALYQAKSNNRGSFAFYSKQSGVEVNKRIHLLDHLRDAVSQGQLELYYQPQFDASEGTLTGVEALIRWAHPSEGIIGPDHFIPLAEESGLIIEIGDWITSEACRQMREWIDADVAPQKIGVNVSAYQIHKQVNFVGWLERTLNQYRVPSSRIEIELTESALINVPQTPDNVLNRLRALGVQIALDDFGTGYSSLEYLSRFPVDRIKIAQKFVVDALTSTRSRAIIEATITLAHSLGIALIVEGVEQYEQLDMLQKRGCNEFQGYYFSEPLNSLEMTEMLSAAAATGCSRKVPERG